jgi:small subunit ribosomal protein S18
MHNMSTIQNYELYIVFKPDTEAQKSEDVINSFLGGVNAQNININREGVKKLAYPINRNRTGVYYLVTFDLELVDVRKLNENTNKFNQQESVMRYIVVNQTEFLVQKAKEKANPSPEFTHHKDVNKGKPTAKKDINNYLGIKAFDYKDVDYLSQFVSPYAKIFGKKRTGNSSKNQRKIDLAIKRARHMALMPFTAKWVEG